MGNMITNGLLAFALLTSTLAASPILTLTPATISGQPGKTVGWGFTLTNDTDYLLPTEVAFCEGPFISGGCMDTYGTFTDFLAQFQSVVLAPSGPGSSITEPFDNPTMQGIGSFQINNTAVAGDKDIGTIFLIYDTYSCDPNTCADPVQKGFSESISASAEVDVQSSATPEPGTISLVGLVLAGLFVPLRRRS